MQYAPEQVEQWAQPAWDDFYKDDSKMPKWADFSGTPKEKQLQIAEEVARVGASHDKPMELAYAAAFGRWNSAQAMAASGAKEEKPAKATKK